MLQTLDETNTAVEAIADAAFDLILLDPVKVLFFRTGGSNVRATVTDPVIGGERTYLRVQLARAFPLSQPDRYIGLRDEKDKDIGMLATLTGLDADSRGILDEELNRRYFVPKIEKVMQVKEEFGTSTWDVQTDRGRRTFIVQNIRESVQTLSPTRLLVTDKDGTRYEFPDVDQLEPDAYTALQRVL